MKVLSVFKPFWVGLFEYSVTQYVFSLRTKFSLIEIN